MDKVRVGLAQINSCVGDIGGNLSKITRYIKEARAKGVDILCFPELAITGYPPEDLLLKPKFIEDNIKALKQIQKATAGITVIVGFANKKEDIYNAAAVLHNKKLVDIYHKQYLPNYGVFDENRYFQSGFRTPVYKIGNLIFGLNICEDIWYPGDPTRMQAVLGDAHIIINVSSSPYYASKVQSRERMLKTRAKDYSSIVVFCNTVGGQDELVFDGHSAVISERGTILARASGFAEELLVCEITTNRIFRSRLHDPRRRKEKQELRQKYGNAEIIALPKLTKKAKPPKIKKPASITPFKSLEQEVLDALVLATRDYVGKNGFKKVVIGLSGGIDSALVAAIAVEALGKRNVIGVSMPSPYSSKGSKTDAVLLSKNLGIELIELPISTILASYLKAFDNKTLIDVDGLTEENLQARIRGNLLMALSNRFGWLVLATGNKSELSVGYCTLYGDLAGGYAVIKDVPKTMVYELCNFYNDSKGKKIIPQSIIDKPPSAELRPDQKDTDSLPPYEILDPILKAYVEDDLSLQEIISAGYDKKIVNDVVRMVDLNEYKRRQAPPGVKITARAFGKDRRFPITNLYSRS